MVTKRLSTEELIAREARRLALLHFLEKNPDSQTLTPGAITEILNSHPELSIIAKNNILLEKSAHEEILKKIGLNSFETDALEGLDL